ncbi:MAG TPA: phosphopantetheine-binding protein [Burkholderiaceae bacterium]|nr:phosphopantetheine-binding protein [Burkholderiaceae bacterium]
MSAHCSASIAAHALRSCALLSDVLVTERADRPPGRNLVAWVCPAPGAPQAAGALHAQLALALGAQRVPATIVCVDTLDGPLPAPDDAILGVRAFELPHGALEQALAAIWQDLLGIAHVGRNAHFFELGGHSSLAVRMVYRVQQSLQVSVAMRELFHQPQLHQFAAIVAERGDAASARAGTLCLPA